MDRKDVPEEVNENMGITALGVTRMDVQAQREPQYCSAKAVSPPHSKCASQKASEGREVGVENSTVVWREGLNLHKHVCLVT
jgi:hypothetical protein